MLEIYNEKLHDLLAPGVGSSTADEPALSIHEVPTHGVFVKGLRKALVRCRAPVSARCSINLWAR